MEVSHEDVKSLCNQSAFSRSSDFDLLGELEWEGVFEVMADESPRCSSDVSDGSLSFDLFSGNSDGSSTDVSSDSVIEMLHELWFRSSNVRTDGSSSSSSEGKLSQDEIDDLDRVNRPSIGSKWHAHGACMPCLFFASRTGCAKGRSCRFCHMSHLKSVVQRQFPCNCKLSL